VNPGEHAVMSRVEDHHWWYLGLRDVIVRTLERPDVRLPDRPRVLDAGCGTGANLKMLAERFRPSYLAGFDLSEEAVALAREKAPEATVHVGDVTRPDLDPDDRGLDLVLSLDVIYIPGMERSMPGFRRLVSALRPGGLLVLNLPAYRWLYSAHDVAIHTKERYTRGEVRGFLEQLGLTPVRLSYRMCLLLPLVVAGRLPSILGRRPLPDRARSDLHRATGPRLHRILFAILRAENRWIARGTRLPWGSSVFAVARREDAAT